MNKFDLMKEIKDEVVNLKKSPLYSVRISNNVLPVIGDGSHDAEVMFIGEAPGRNEAKTGKPFCGAAGKILDTLLGSINIDRKDVYITNIVKDRPPQNRDPSPEEIEVYGPFLDRQIEIVQPKIIATLGRYAMNYILRKFELEHEIEAIGKAHGKTYDADTSYGKIKIIVLYHPCVAVYNAKTLGVLKSDLQNLKKLMK